jgi:hypothetical protein
MFFSFNLLLLLIIGAFPKLQLLGDKLYSSSYLTAQNKSGLKDLAKFHGFSVRTFDLETFNSPGPKRQTDYLIIKQLESAFSGKIPSCVNVVNIQRYMIYRACLHSRLFGIVGFNDQVFQFQETYPAIIVL